MPMTRSVCLVPKSWQKIVTVPSKCLLHLKNITSFLYVDHRPRWTFEYFSRATALSNKPS